MKAEIKRILRTYAFPVIILTICAFLLPLSVKILNVRFFRAIGISMQTEIINILWALFLIILMYLFTARPKGIDYELTFPASRSRQLISRYITVLAYFVSIYLVILIFTKTNILGMKFADYFIFISSVFAITYLWREYRNQFLISLALMVIIVFVFFKVKYPPPFDTEIISGSSWFDDNLSYLAIPLVFLVFYLLGCRKKFLTLFAAMVIFTMTYSCFHYLEHYSPYGKTMSMSGYKEFITLHKDTANIKNIKYNIKAKTVEVAKPSIRIKIHLHDPERFVFSFFDREGTDMKKNEKLIVKDFSICHFKKHPSRYFYQGIEEYGSVDNIFNQFYGDISKLYLAKLKALYIMDLDSFSYEKVIDEIRIRKYHRCPDGILMYKENPFFISPYTGIMELPGYKYIPLYDGENTYYIASGQLIDENRNVLLRNAQEAIHPETLRTFYHNGRKLIYDHKIRDIPKESKLNGDILYIVNGDILDLEHLDNGQKDSYDLSDTVWKDSERTFYQLYRYDGKMYLFISGFWKTEIYTLESGSMQKYDEF